MAMWKVTSDKGVTHDCAGPDTIFLHEYVAWNAEAVRNISFCGAEAATPLQVPIPRSEHGFHIRHTARVPQTNVTIEN